MVNLFGFDVTDPDNPGDPAILQYRVREITPDVTKQWTAFGDYVQHCKARSELPPPAAVLRTVSGAGAPVLAFFSLYSILHYGMAYTVQHAAVLLRLFCIFLVLWVMLTVWLIRRKRSVEATDGEIISGRMELLINMTRASLGIPADAAEIDILAELYVMRDGFPQHKDIGAAGFESRSHTAFVQGESLFLGSVREVYEIPLSSLRRMKRSDELYGFMDWHKEEKPSDGIYNGCRVTRSPAGAYLAQVYSVEVIDLRGDFYLLIPEYERDTFTALTHLTPEAE